MRAAPHSTTNRQTVAARGDGLLPRPIPTSRTMTPTPATQMSASSASWIGSRMCRCSSCRRYKAKGSRVARHPDGRARHLGGDRHAEVVEDRRRDVADGHQTGLSGRVRRQRVHRATSGSGPGRSEGPYAAGALRHRDRQQLVPGGRHPRRRLDRQLDDQRGPHRWRRGTRRRPLRAGTHPAQARPARGRGRAPGWRRWRRRRECRPRAASGAAGRRSTAAVEPPARSDRRSSAGVARTDAGADRSPGAPRPGERSRYRLLHEVLERDRIRDDQDDAAGRGRIGVGDGRRPPCDERGARADEQKEGRAAPRGHESAGADPDSRRTSAPSATSFVSRPS